MNTNVVTLEGRLTRDPEIKRVGSDETAVTSFGFAVDKRVKQGNDWVSKPGFYEITCWKYLAEAAMQLAKGDAIMLVGSLDFESWEQEGQKRSRVKVTANAIGRTLFKNENGAKAKTDDDEIPF